MKRYQTGEVMLVMMVMMLAIVLLGNRHMGMMGHGDSHAERSGQAEQQMPAPKESPEPQLNNGNLRGRA